MSKKKLLLIDANSLLHRAYHAYPPLTTPLGEIVGAVYGFTMMLLGAIEKINPTHVIVAWDVGKRTFRHDKFSEYKAGRAKTDQELIDQIGRTKEVVETLNIPQFGIENFEADDLIGTLSEQGKKTADQVIILTGDRDSFQLVDKEKVVVHMPSGGGKFSKDRGMSIMDETAVKMKYGITPEQVVDWKGLVGDQSDNIPGIKGIGEVTAKKILDQQPTIDKIYDHLDEIEVSPRIKELLRSGRESAFMSREIATINREAPIKLDWDKCRLADYDQTKAKSLFEELQFKSVINRLPKDSWEEDLEEVFK